MRIGAATLLGLLLTSTSGSARAAEGPTPTPETRYQQEKKSGALAVTLEALCPIAGAGAFYAHDSDRGTVLAVLSAVSGGAAVGSLFWIIHLDHQSPSGVDRVWSDVQSGTAWTVLVLGGATYLLTRISGLSFAPDAVAAFNGDLYQRLGVPAKEPEIRFRALATGVSLIWRF